MAQHYIEIIGIAFLLVFAVTMFYQGTMILFQQRGYSQKMYQRDSDRMRLRMEELIKEKHNHNDYE
jgi:low affinity Fe/Cu permease